MTFDSTMSAYIMILKAQVTKTIEKWTPLKLKLFDA
jgi:hypothetical protein